MRKYTQKELREYIRLKLARDLTTVSNSRERATTVLKPSSAIGERASRQQSAKQPHILTGDNFTAHSLTTSPALYRFRASFRVILVNPPTLILFI